jgi:hypothetical protein
MRSFVLLERTATFSDVEEEEGTRLPVKARKGFCSFENKFVAEFVEYQSPKSLEKEILSSE